MKKKSTFLKIYLISFICLLTLFAGLFLVLRPHSGLAAHASSLPTSYKLSEMTDKECIDFIKDNNIEIPEGFADSGSFVHDIIRSVEEKPDIKFAYNYNVTLNFAENIKALVNNYYGVQESDIALFASSGYELQYNWVQNSNGDWVSSGGAWDYSWWDYNCYAYAIGKTENVFTYDGSFAYQPGYFGGTGEFDFDEDNCSIYDLALIVRDDLVSLGYYVSASSIEPTEIAPDQTLICVRRGPLDYHFMRKNFSDGYWYHKPGRTAPLKYKYSPDQYVWVSEGSFEGIERYNGTIYDSDICYITYGTSPFETPTFDVAISGNNCRITGLKPGVILLGSLTIPESIDGKTVTRIENSVFSSCTVLTSVTVPETVTSIGTQAFYGCSRLEKVIVLSKSGVVILGNWAFANTSNKLKIYVPEELYNTYSTAINWSGYASKLDKIYMYGNKPYILEQAIYQGDEVYTFLWIYTSNPYGSEGPTDYGVVGGGDYTYCYIRLDAMPGYLQIPAPYQDECYMWIWLGEYADGLQFDIYNYQEQYVMSVTVENGILCIPLMDFIESYVFCRFYIEAGYWNNSVVEFDLSDIEIILIVASYI